MKNILLITSLITGFIVSAQETVEKYVKEGISHHDAGAYDLAIEAYQNALDLDENSALVNYEIAMTYMYTKQYENSLKHANKVIELNDQYLIPSYIIKGNSLDALGRGEEAITAYEFSIKNLGGDYMLYYNLGLTLFNRGNYDEAQESLTKGILENPNHASSHLLLGYIMDKQKNKAQSMLSLYYFLFLEPDSGRSQEAITNLKTQFWGNVEKTDKGGTNITLNSLSSDKKNDFGSMELMISIITANNSIGKNKDMSEDELFLDNTESFFKIMGELKKKKNKGLWWEFYIPFFYEMAKTKHLETYCYYITQSNSNTAVDWLNSNENRIEKFNQWLSK